ncbi:hypothetical protein E1B28_010333 [Marasmius oreades]|uniref:BTB domain-containing protein n=1 Tax=Marasmius oreades TaxID=181124 RepID=A0A9P7RXK0_9AGAR|nr:uncharacterized protein E1B28_010333 [Marasmius oreades]KAG7091285.1 hypothetical protein E1B28_010333 [Marasmius oreades]
MPALLLDPNHHYELPTYPPRPLQSRSSSTSTNDSGVILTPGTSPTPSAINADSLLPVSPHRGLRTISLSTERSHPSVERFRHSFPLSNEESFSLQGFTNSVSSIPSLSNTAPVTVLKSQPIVAPSLFEFPIKDDDGPCDPTSKSSSLKRKSTELFDTPCSGSPSGSVTRSVSRGRSIKRSIKWVSPTGSSSRENSPKHMFSAALHESSCRSVSPIPASCSLLMAPEPLDSTPSLPSSPTLSSSLCSLPLPELSKSRSPPPLIFEPLPCTALPSVPPIGTTSVIPTLSPRTIFNGLGYNNTLPSPPKALPRSNPLHSHQGSNGILRFPESPQTTELFASSSYYFNDGNVIFQVRNKLYKVHRYFFEQNSLTMTVMISHVLERAALVSRGSHVNVANFPVMLPDTDPVDFERLLSIFYPKDYSQHDAQTVEDWTSILRVSSRFGMTKIRSLALDNLYMTANAVDKIALNNEFHFDDVEIEDEWVFDAYAELVTRAEPLTLQEGEKIGMRDVIRIQAMKAALMKDLRRYLDADRVRAMVEAYL